MFCDRQGARFQLLRICSYAVPVPSNSRKRSSLKSLFPASPKFWKLFHGVRYILISLSKGLSLRQTTSTGLSYERVGRARVGEPKTNKVKSSCHSSNFSSMGRRDLLCDVDGTRHITWPWWYHELCKLCFDQFRAFCSARGRKPLFMYLFLCWPYKTVLRDNYTAVCVTY